MFHPVTFSASGQSPSVTFVHHLTVHSRVLTQRFGPITAGLFFPPFCLQPRNKTYAEVQQQRRDLIFVHLYLASSAVRVLQASGHKRLGTLSRIQISIVSLLSWRRQDSLITTCCYYRRSCPYACCCSRYYCNCLPYCYLMITFATTTTTTTTTTSTSTSTSTTTTTTTVYS